MSQPIPEVQLNTVEGLQRWLAANHDTSRGIWLVAWRPHTGRERIAYDDLVELCLCYGWIDSTIRTVDDQRNAQRLTPRRPGSAWSAINKERLTRLEAADRILPPGYAAIDRAKMDGSFWFLDDVEALVVPPDLVAALGEDLARFEGLSPGRRKQALFWIKLAKRESTRTDRIRQIADAAGEGRSLF